MELIALQIALTAVALVVSAYFSAVEIALISANRWRLEQEGAAGTPGALLALELLGQRERVLSSTLVGVTIANHAAASISTSVLDRLLGAGWTTTLVSTIGVTLLILVLGETVPKVYSKPRSDRLLMLLARPMLATEQLLLPLSAGLRLYLELLLRLIRRAPRRPFVTREELKSLVHEVESATGAGRQEKQMLRSILDFGGTTVREVMVPMPEVVSIERESSTELLRALARRHDFTRVPVYHRRVDKVVGVINVYDVLFDPAPAESLDAYIRPAKLVPESQRIDRLLVELQREGQTLAVVVSEFGSCVGIASLEDIVEEIVGEIREEHDRDVRKIRRIGERTYIVNALTDVDDLNEELDLRLPKGRYDTLSGLVLEQFGRIPAEGESFEIERVRIEVVEVHPFGVRAVKLVLPEEAREAEE